MASLPKTYKAVVIKAANEPLTLSDVELKHPSEHQVLVKVLACGVCFSDLAIARGHLGDIFPRIPGHEIVGDIVELGSSVTNFKLGERVGGPWHGGHDGTCRACQRGNFNICENEEVNGLSRDGGYAEYVLLRAEALARIPRDMDPAEAAPLLCAGITVFNGLRKQHIQHGALVAVQGLGALGHLAVQFANKMGYEVAVLSSGNDKAAFAKELGAHHYINSRDSDAAQELTKLGGAECIIQTAPNPKLLGPLMGGLATGGKLLLLSTVGEASFDTTNMVIKRQSVQGWPSGHALDSEETIAFARRHGVKCMIEKFPLVDVQKAVDSVAEGKPRFKNVLVME
jgi:D-arabinose 1-dehydrogenase-like Zn-dependent alcohol dehydrogenase